MTPAASLAQLADLIGEDAAGELAREFAGTSICLPADHEQEPRLEKAIGALAASCLCEMMEGQTVEFPEPVKRRKAPQARKAKPTVSSGSGRVTKSNSELGSKVLDDIASVIGIQAARKLAYEFMGQRIYIPKNPAQQPRIEKVIGPELAAKLCDSMWRLIMVFPVRLARNIRVLELHEQGLKSSEIARQLFMNERQIFRELQKQRGPKKVGRAENVDRSTLILRLHKDGKSPKDIAAQISVAESTVRRVIHKHLGPQDQRQKESAERSRQIIDLYRSGMTRKAIAVRLSLARSTVQKAIQRGALVQPKAEHKEGAG